MSDRVKTVSPRGSEFVDLSGPGWFLFDDGSTLRIQLSGYASYGFSLTHVFSRGVLNYDELSGSYSLCELKKGSASQKAEAKTRRRPQAKILGAEDATALSTKLCASMLAGDVVPGLANAENVTRALLGAFASAEFEGSPLNVRDQVREDYWVPWA